MRRLRSELMDGNTSLHSSTSGRRKQSATTSQFGRDLRLLTSSVTSLISNHDLLLFLMREFYECRRAVYFGLRSDFLREALSLTVRSNCSPLSVTFRSLLTGGSLAPKSSRSKPAQAPLFTH